MYTEEPSVEELRARFKALDHPLEASDEVVPPHDLTHKEDKSPSMWRVLLQLRVLLPYISKLVPLLDGGSHQSSQAHELEEGLTEVQSGNRAMRVQVQDQAVQMKRVEEQLERLRETTERNTLEQQELIEYLKSFTSTFKAFAVLGTLLLLVNAGLVIYLLLRLRH